MNNFEQKSLASLNIVRSLTNTLGGGTKKSLGQNFLVNQNTLFRFINSISLGKEDIIIEIGPGIGVVSYTLCEQAKFVYLIEIDQSKKEALDKTLENFTNYEIIWEDATSIDYTLLGAKIKEKFGSVNVKIIGSLPYNVGKRIIYNLFTSELNWTEASFFLQREVTDNYTSLPPRAEFLGISAQIFAEPKFAFAVPAEHFYPIPKVSTGVIHFTRHNKFDMTDKKSFSSFIKQGFIQPRKTVFNNLKSLGISQELLKELNLSATVRPSELTIEQWFTLYKQKETQNRVSSKR